MTESDPHYDFVELNRTFHELSKYASEDDELDLGHAFHVGDRLAWPDLIQQYRLVILSEAGSGKTAEIRNIARDLRAKSKSAFFIRLEHIPADFEDGFEVGSFEEFQAWLASNDEGWLLLDSVDEARLRNPGDFALAVRKLGRRLATAKDRTHIIITGRTNAWRPKTDLALCASHLPFTPVTTTAKEDTVIESDDMFDAVETSEAPDEKPHPVFKIVALDDLSSAQIEVFAKARGINNSKAFLEAIDRADAWSFTSRPQDLMELTEFWLDQGRIGSRLEIMRNSIARRLEERDQERVDAHPLAPQKALRGARLVAAATTLAQESTLKLADKWTGPDLFERLENQLCGDYLRDNRSAHGIFILVHNGEKAGWDVPGGSNRVDFEGLIAALRGHWESIADKFPNVDNITVVGIDLTKRAA